jgi:hypothetical protein
MDETLILELLADPGIRARLIELLAQGDAGKKDYVEMSPKRSPSKPLQKTRKKPRMKISEGAKVKVPVGISQCMDEEEDQTQNEEEGGYYG